ncbi:MAG: DUF1835 domain-containing protein [Cytophagaceae bacterium]|nr:DUF1835 domain-containing protein [Cytophagaceae bacterium]
MEDNQPKNILHITNGDSLNQRLRTLEIQGDFAVWREMLCEGPTHSDIGSDSFIELRKQFLAQSYEIDTSYYNKKFIQELDKIAKAVAHEQVYLWFEFDLFCHINMLAAISYLNQIQFRGELFLVCSGKVAGHEQLKGLSELNDELLLQHFHQAIKLTTKDRALANQLWIRYCSKDHQLWDPSVAQDSSFPYLAACIAAHIQRFPSILNGLNALEKQLLMLIQTYQISSDKQFCGYGLSYQGYYGYGDLQINRIIQKLSLYYEVKDEMYTLTTLGTQLINNEASVASDSIANVIYGGAPKWSFYFNPNTNLLQTQA